jgi:hypothetical protein
MVMRRGRGVDLRPLDQLQAFRSSDYELIDHDVVGECEEVISDPVTSEAERRRGTGMSGWGQAHHQKVSRKEMAVRFREEKLQSTS